MAEKELDLARQTRDKAIARKEGKRAGHRLRNKYSKHRQHRY